MAYCQLSRKRTELKITNESACRLQGLLVCKRWFSTDQLLFTVGAEDTFQLRELECYSKHQCFMTCPSCNTHVAHCKFKKGLSASISVGACHRPVSTGKLSRDPQCFGDPGGIDTVVHINNHTARTLWLLTHQPDQPPSSELRPHTRCKRMSITEHALKISSSSGLFQSFCRIAKLKGDICEIDLEVEQSPVHRSYHRPGMEDSSMDTSGREKLLEKPLPSPTPSRKSKRTEGNGNAKVSKGPSHSQPDNEVRASTGAACMERNAKPARSDPLPHPSRTPSDMDQDRQLPPSAASAQEPISISGVTGCSLPSIAVDCSTYPAGEPAIAAVRKRFQIKVALIVVTDTEFRVLMTQLQPPIEEGRGGSIKQTACGEFEFWVGSLGVCNIILGWAPQKGPLSIQHLVADVLRLWQPVWVINVGIGWGVGPGSGAFGQKLGDVMVSTRVAPWGIDDKCQKSSVHSRIAEIPAGSTILARARTAQLFWPPLTQPKAEWYPAPGITGKHPQAYKALLGDVISCGVLLNDTKAKQKLLARASQDRLALIGGEMEGAGLANACRDKAQWILIKGICDWGDSHKNDGYQELAMYNAIDFVRYLLSRIS